MKILFVGKKDDFFCQLAKEFTLLNCPETTVILGKRGDPLSPEALAWEGDFIMSYLSPWIIPQTLLERARTASINFHTGPPEYPGIGCTNFALYNEETVYGITCHHMLAQVDRGQIIAVKRFPLLKSDSVLSLTQRCYAYLLTTFYEILTGIIQEKPLPVSQEKWTRKPYTRAELNALAQVTPDMSPLEKQRRIRATTYLGWPGAVS